MKKLAIIGSFAIANALLTAQTAGTKKPVAQPPSAQHPAAAKTANNPPPVLLPGKAQIEEAMQRTFGYDPAVKWQIYDIRPSQVPGLVEVLVAINNQQPNTIFMSPNAQVAIVGNVIPFGPDPFAPAREKIRGADGPARGPKTGVIEIVEFSDLQCPHCKAAQPIIDKLVADFPQVRFVFQQFPLPASLHPWAMKAAQYSDCVAQTKPQAFWDYINKVFENQGAIALATADDKLKEIAQETQTDPEKISACAASPATDARIRHSLDLGQSLQVNQTPSVFVNGRLVAGIASIPYESVKKLVEFEIEHAGK